MAPEEPKAPNQDTRRTEVLQPKPNKSGHRRSFFRAVFGDDLGEYIRGMLGFLVIMLLSYLFILGPMFLIRTLGGSKDSETKIAELKQLPPDTRSVIEEIGKVRLRTQELLHRLEKDIGSSEYMIETKKRALNDLQQKLNLLKLTPEQLVIISEYERTLQKRTTLWQWITQPSNIFSGIFAFILAGFFYILGRRKERKKLLKSKKLSEQ